MHFVFDVNKNQTNLAKHGLGLSLAVSLNWDTALVWQDQRKNYGLRKANLREAKHYVSQTSTHFP
jgi:uncharacterized DUF497 family protein